MKVVQEYITKVSNGCNYAEHKKSIAMWTSAV